MTMLRKFAAAGIAGKLIGEARKPQNRAKVKRVLSSIRSRTSGR